MWPFWLVAVSVCGRSGLWPFRSVAIPVFGRSGLWPFRFVVVLTCYPQIYTIYVHTFLFIVSLKSGISLSKWFSRFHPAETSFCWYFCIEYTTRILQLWVLISTVHLTNNMHVRIYMQFIPWIMKTNIRQYTVAYSVLNWGVVVSVRRCFGLSTFWSVKFLVGIGRSPRRRFPDHAFMPYCTFPPHTYISIGFGYVRIYRHGENASCRACLIEKYISIYGNKMKYSHIPWLVSDTIHN